MVTCFAGHACPLGGKAAAGSVGPSTASTHILIFDAVLGKMVPDLELEASCGFSTGSFYLAFLVANQQAICDGPVGCIDIAKGEQ